MLRACGCCWIARRRMFRRQESFFLFFMFRREKEKKEKKGVIFCETEKKQSNFFLNTLFSAPRFLFSLSLSLQAISEELAPSSVVIIPPAFLPLALAPASSCGSSSCAIASGVALQLFSGE